MLDDGSFLWDNTTRLVRAHASGTVCRNVEGEDSKCEALKETETQSPSRALLCRLAHTAAMMNWDGRFTSVVSVGWLRKRSYAFGGSSLTAVSFRDAFGFFRTPEERVGGASFVTASSSAFGFLSEISRSFDVKHVDARCGLILTFARFEIVSFAVHNRLDINYGPRHVIRGKIFTFIPKTPMSLYRLPVSFVTGVSGNNTTLLVVHFWTYIISDNVVNLN